MFLHSKVLINQGLLKKYKLITAASVPGELRVKGGRLQKNGHKDGLSYNFNQLRVTSLFLCLKWLF